MAMKHEEKDKHDAHDKGTHASHAPAHAAAYAEKAEPTPEEEAQAKELSDLEAYHSKVMTDLENKRNGFDAQIAHLEEQKAANVKEAAQYEKGYLEQRAALVERHGKQPAK